MLAGRSLKSVIKLVMNLFQTKEYLEIFFKHFCREQDIVDGIWEKQGDKLLLLGMKPVLGKEEVTDFGYSDIATLPVGYRHFQLDYIREDSATYTRFKDRAEKIEVSPYIDLPASWDEYLAGLERKHRKEIKRKFKRLEELEYEFVNENNMPEFIRLHRLSDPAKNKFMSSAMAGFFQDVLGTKIPGWQTSLSFLKIDGQYAAGVVGFDSGDEYWLYNSGYDPRFNFYSAGLLLNALTIKLAIEAGKKKYDFLRGSERYKYELGAKDLNLYRIEINQ